MATALAATPAAAEPPDLPFAVDGKLPDVTFSGDNSLIGKWCGELIRTRVGNRKYPRLKVCLLILSINGDQADVLYAWDTHYAYPPMWGQTTTIVTPSKRSGMPTVLVTARIASNYYYLRAEFQGDKASAEWDGTTAYAPFEGIMEKVR
jgi:hypothetical protein